MFDLEQTIADWRRQMLTAGIETPVPLEELEIHLREEIDRQTQSGMDEEKAFELATRQIGQAAALNAEFRSAGGFLGWLGVDTHMRINRVLALIWLAYCSLIFFRLAMSLLAILYFSNRKPMPGWYLEITVGVLSLSGMIASILVFGGKQRAAVIIQLIASLGLVATVKSFVDHGVVEPPAGLFAVFYVLSIWLLRKPKKLKPLPN